MPQELLFPDDRKQIAHLVMEGDVETLMRTLRGKGWLHAATIEDLLSWSERKIRAVANASEGQVLSGQHGYKLTIECTPEELKAGTQWLRSQARAMIGRSLRIARVWHEAANSGAKSNP